jgi:hypothetical protein
MNNIDIKLPMCLLKCEFYLLNLSVLLSESSIANILESLLFPMFSSSMLIWYIKSRDHILLNYLTFIQISLITVDGVFRSFR